jgi:hypothetical protein
MLPAGPLDTAHGSMETLEQIDARIAELEDEQEILRMKIARNARTPLGRLPDELLVNIVDWLMEEHWCSNAQLMHLLTSVYARLRAALVAAPALWVKVELGRSQALIDRHITRAHPSLPEVDGDVYTKWEFQQAITLIPCVSALRLVFDTSNHNEGKKDWCVPEPVNRAKQAGAVVAALAAADISKLTTLKLEDPCTCSFYVDLSAVAGAHLSALELNIYVTGLPALPQLRRLVLIHTNCPVSEVHKLLAGAPRLEHIELKNFAKNRPRVPVLDRVDLHHLATLKIHDRSSSAILLFGTLPNPSKRLHLNLLSADSADDILGFSAEPLASMLARIAQFWTQLNGEDTALPLPWIEQHGVTATLSIMSERVSNEWAPLEHASLVFIASGCTLRHHPLLDEIEVLRISHCKAGDDGFDLGVVKHARHVFLICHDRDQDMEPLRAWIVGQLRRGRPVQSIEFWDCDATSIKPLFDELLQLQAAQRITWDSSGVGM